MTALQNRLDAYTRYKFATQAVPEASSSSDTLVDKPTQFNVRASTVELHESPMELQGTVGFIETVAPEVEGPSQNLCTWTAFGGSQSLLTLPSTGVSVLGQADVFEGSLSLPTLPSTGVWVVGQASVLDDPETTSSSPFEILDELRDEKAKVKELINYVRRSLDCPYARRLERHLSDLMKRAEEESPYQSEPLADSLRMLIRFLQVSPDISYPGVTLTPRGNFRARWSVAPNKLCAAEFFPDQGVHFVVFSPDRMRPNQTIRLSGIASVTTFLNTVEPHGVLEWMTS